MPKSRQFPVSRISGQQLIEAVQTGKHVSGLHNKWGWLNLLLDAHDGQSVRIGAPASFPPFLDEYPTAGIKLTNGNITIGGSSLGSYTIQYLDNSISPTIWWRSTKPNHYYLDSVEYFDNTHDLPSFRTVSADALLLLPIIIPHWLTIGISQLFDLGGAVTIDAYGNIYATLFGGFAPGIGLGIGVGEGYINYNPANIIPSITGHGYAPSEQEIHDTLARWCLIGGVNIGPSAFQGNVCGGLSTAFIYGYTVGILGDSLGASYTFEPIGKVPALAWNYINERPGASSSDVLNRIALDLLINPCP